MMTLEQHNPKNKRLPFLAGLGAFFGSPQKGAGQNTAFPLARVVGALCAALLMGGIVLLVPLRGVTPSIADLVVVSGVLLANVGTLTLIQHYGERDYAALAMFISLLFAGMVGLSAIIMVSITLLLAFDGLIQRKNVRNFEISFYGGVATAVFGITLIEAWPSSSASLMVLAVYAPIFAVLYERLTLSLDKENNRGEESQIDTAFLAASTHYTQQTIIIVDKGGMIEATTLHRNKNGQEDKQAGDVNYASHLAQGLYIGDAILISDRVPLFQAISEAIHKGISKHHVLVRLREAMPEGGYRQPPQFTPCSVSVMPAFGISARATLALSPIREMGADEPRGTAIPPFSARALHDFVSPFNAGLGYLEMLADSSLAPKDAALSRQFASNARNAVMSGFRNATLLARTMALQNPPLDQKTAPAPSFAKLVQDAARSIGLREGGDKMCIQFEHGVAGRRLVAEPEKLRFALEVLFTLGLNAAPAEQTLTFEARDDGEAGCTILLRLADASKWDFPKADAFETMLEKNAVHLTGGQLSRHSSLGLILVMPNAFLPVSVFEQHANHRLRDEIPDHAGMASLLNHKRAS